MNKIIEKELWEIFNYLRKTYPNQWTRPKYKILKDYMKDIRWSYIPEHREMSEDLIKWMIARDKRRYENIAAWKSVNSYILATILEKQKLSDDFINKFKYFDRETYLAALIRNPYISSIKIKIAIKYNFIEKENNTHFIEYTKVNNKVKEFEEVLNEY